MSFVLFVGALVALHGSTLGFPFLADDYFFYDETRAGARWSPLTAIALTENYFRPVGRELYFYVGSRVFGPNPVGFHLVNWALLVLTVGMVFLLARRLGAGPRASALAAGVYALVYSHRVLMAWVSCSQDLLASALGLGAALLYVSGHRAWAAAAFFAGLFAKESIAALPLVLVMWEAWRLGSGTSLWSRIEGSVRRTLPLWGASFAWVAIVVAVRLAKNAWFSVGGTLPVADVMLQPGSVWEGMRLALLTYVYLDQPLSYLGLAAARTPWPVLAIVLAVAGAVLATRLPRGDNGPAGRKEPRGADAWRLGLVWAVVGALPVALVGHHFSAYYVSFSAIGFAVLAGWALARTPWPVAAVVIAGAAWADAVANHVGAFRVVQEVEERAGVSYVSIARLEWQKRFLTGLEAALRRDPPPRGAVVYLSHAPSYLALATFGDRAPKVWFDDPTLELSYITRYLPAADPRPRRFVRFDADRWTFDVLPNDLVDAIVEGEEALAAGRPDIARPALERALRLATPGAHDLERAALFNSYGLACYQAGDPAAARLAWQQTLALEPADRGALLNLAAWHAGRGDFAEARNLTVRVLEGAPGDPMALYYLARIDRSLGNEIAAKRAWDMLAESQPAFADSVARKDGAP